MTTPRDYTMKYQGKNPLEKLHPDEPYFFIRAQDKLSVAAIMYYADLVKKESERAADRGEGVKAKELLKSSLGILKVANIFMDWQEANKDKVKIPD